MRVRTTLFTLLVSAWIPLGIAGQANQEMRYSVQISSLGSMQLALDATRQLRSPDMPAYVVPVQVQGRTYYRVMAGLLPTQQQATALMNDLVARGLKESANAWDVRDTNLAFALDAHASEAEAYRARDEAQARGIPAYVVPVEENGGLEYWTWAGGFANSAESTVLQDLLTRQGDTPPLLRRSGLTAVDARILTDRLAQEAAAEQAAAERAAQEAEAAAAAAPTETPPDAAPPAEEPPMAQEVEEEAPPMPTAAQQEAAMERSTPEAAIPPTSAPEGSNNFTSIFVGAVGTTTAYAGSGPMGYGGAIIAGVLLGGIVEIGGHGGAEYVSEDGAFGSTAATATVLSYSGFGGLYTPALRLGGVSVRIGGRGGWGAGQVRVSASGFSTTVDMDTGVFVEPVLKIGSGSLQVIGAFRYFLDEMSGADWTGSFGVIWGT